MTSKQRAYLRGLANKLPAKYQIGKSGLENAFIDQIRDALEANELIKVHVLENSMEDPYEICHRLCEMINAEPVQVIGNKFIIYKESRENKKIELPKAKKTQN